MTWEESLRLLTETFPPEESPWLLTRIFPPLAELPWILAGLGKVIDPSTFLAGTAMGGAVPSRMSKARQEWMQPVDAYTTVFIIRTRRTRKKQ